jgi:malonate decarboxylase gamma subunit
MNINGLLDRLFGSTGHSIRIDGIFLDGSAVTGNQNLAVIGTREHAAIDSALALKISASILGVIQDDLTAGCPPRPILFMVDTQGQELSRHEELLCLNGYFAHVAQCVDLARRHGHRTVSLIHGEAVSGGFLAFGLMADRICALPDAQVRVMDLKAMSRITKIPYDRLVELSVDSPVFAPGAENYWRMGAVHEIWAAESDWRNCLAAALKSVDGGDNRAIIGQERGGRLHSAPVAQLVAAA